MMKSLHGRVESHVGTPSTWSVGLGTKNGPPLKVTGGPPADSVGAGVGVGVGVGVAQAASTSVLVNWMSSTNQPTPGCDPTARRSAASRNRTNRSRPAKAPRSASTLVMAAVASPPVHAGREAIALPKLPEMVPL